jgi:APA family basic amino acid/polyamine antiporter
VSSRSPVFVREATGLVRELSVWDAMFFNILTASIFTFTFYTDPPIAFPGGNMVLATILMTIISLPMFVAYSMLGVSMPRGGGDYMFQSRTLPSVLAFTFGFNGGVFWSLSFIAWAGWWFITSGFAPLLIRLGLLYNNNSLLNLGVWATTVPGLVTITSVLILTVTTFHFFGMRMFVKLQRVMMASVVLCIIAMLYLFASTPTSSFISSFNSALGPLNNSSNYYQSIINTAIASGYNPSPHFSWYNTIGIFSVLQATMVYFYYHLYFGGELKRASQLRRQIIATVGSAVVTGLLVYAFGIWLFLRAVNPAFWNAFAYDSFTGSITHFLPGLPPNIPALATIMTSNIVLILIITVGFMLQSYFIFFNSSLPQSRVLFAMTFDRLFPSWLADVSDRFRSPIKLLLIIMAVGEIWVFLIWYTTWAALFATYLIVNALILLSMLVAILFPFLKKTRHIYESSPASKYKILGIPIITVCGIVGFVLMSVIVWYTLTTPSLGFANEQSEIAMAIGLIVAGIYFYVVKLYRKHRNGIDIELAFREIPPE